MASFASSATTGCARKQAWTKRKCVLRMTSYACECHHVYVYQYSTATGHIPTSMFRRMY